MFDFSVDKPEPKKKKKVNKPSGSPSKLAPRRVRSSSSDSEDQAPVVKPSRRLASPKVLVSSPAAAKGTHVQKKKATDFLFGGGSTSPSPKLTVVSKPKPKAPPRPIVSDESSEDIKVKTPLQKKGVFATTSAGGLAAQQRAKPPVPKPSPPKSLPPPSVPKQQNIRHYSSGSSSSEERGGRSTPIAVGVPNPNVPILHETSAPTRNSGSSAADRSPPRPEIPSSVVPPPTIKKPTTPTSKAQQDVQERVRNQELLLTPDVAHDLTPVTQNSRSEASTLVELVERDLGYDRVKLAQPDSNDPYERYLYKVGQFSSGREYRGEIDPYHSTLYGATPAKTTSPFTISVNEGLLSQSTPLSPLLRTGVLATSSYLSYTTRGSGYREMMQAKGRRQLISDEYVISPQYKESIEKLSGELTWIQIFNSIECQPKRRRRRW